MGDQDRSTMEESIEDEEQIRRAAAMAPVSSSYKVLGLLNDPSGVGVLGQNDASTGTPIGVEGAVPNASDGYGLSTADDARIEGTLDTAETDFVVEAGTTSTGDAQNVVQGHAVNTVTGVPGATIGGGGFDDGSKALPNQVQARYGTISGGADNTASGNRATVGGGVGNTASGQEATVGGGFGNEARTKGATIAGGGDIAISAPRNVVYDRFGTIGGGDKNQAGSDDGDATNHVYATVGGGFGNEARTEGATIAGGGDNSQSPPRNVVYDNFGTIGGGDGNQAGSDDGTPSTAEYATVGGGDRNTASGQVATVGGGVGNTASGTRATVGGGWFNTASGESATVPGGADNTASSFYCFAAGRDAEAVHEGSFVWSDSGSSTFSSQSTDQFLVDAAGGVGLGTDSPGSQLHVVDTLAQSTHLPEGHVATIENESTDSSADVLLLQTNTSSPDGTTNYVTFNDADGAIGSIEVDSSGNINYTSGGADYAEYVPRADPDEEIEAGEVVGVVEGAVTRRTTDAADAMVVSDRAVVTGNSPGNSPEERAGYETVGFLGQVPVRVRGPVETGDLIVPSGDNDGTGRSIGPGEWRPGDGPIVGRAWESDDDEGVSEVTVAVGLETGKALGPTLAGQQEIVEELNAENNALREDVTELEAAVDRKDERIEELASRLATLEDQVAGLASDAGGSGAPADD